MSRKCKYNLFCLGPDHRNRPKSLNWSKDRLKTLPGSFGLNYFVRITSVSRNIHAKMTWFVIFISINTMTWISNLENTLWLFSREIHHYLVWKQSFSQQEINIKNIDVQRLVEKVWYLEHDDGLLQTNLQKTT